MYFDGHCIKYKQGLPGVYMFMGDESSERKCSSCLNCDILGSLVYIAA